MKVIFNIRKYLILAVAISSVVSTLGAQTVTELEDRVKKIEQQISSSSTTPTGTMVEYSFTDGKFKGEFPFDQNFTIKFTNIPNQTDTINIKVWNTTKAIRAQREIKNKSKQRNDSPVTISKNSILSSKHIPLIINEKIGVRNTNGTAILGFPNKLAPNNSYYIEILRGNYIKLSKDKKESIEDKLMQSKDLQDAILQSANDIKSGEDIRDVNRYLRGAINRELKSNNLEMKVLEANESQLESNFKTLINQVNAIEQFDNLKKTTLHGLSETKKNNIENFFNNETVFSITIKEREKELIELIDNENQKAATINSILEIRELIDIKSHVEKINTLYLDVVYSIGGTYSTDIKTNARRYIFADVGYGIAPGTAHFSHVAAKIHLRPVNDYIPLKHYPFFWDRVLVATSFMAGITVTNNFYDSSKNTGILNNEAVLTGFSFHIVPSVKLNSGAYWYFKEQSPLVSRNKLAPSFYVSLSIDFDITPKFNSLRNTENTTDNN